MTVSVDRSPDRMHVWQALRTDAHLVGLDALIVASAYLVALVLRFDGSVPSNYWHNIPFFILLAISVHIFLHASMGLYGRVWLQAGPAEAWQLIVASATATGLLVCCVLVTGPERVVPLSVPVSGGAFALLLLGGLRFHSRVLASRTARRGDGGPASGTRVVLVGPVNAAGAVLAQMRAQPSAGLIPVAIVTDDASAWHRTLSGVPVTGPLHALAEVAARHAGEQVLLVPGGAEHEAVQVAELARQAGLRARILPSLHEPVDTEPRLRDIRDLSLEDLLGRDPIEIDDDSIRTIVTGRRVLVTGAGGSIGREVAAQVARLAPAALLLLDHDETHLHDVVALLDGAQCTPVLGDIRDEALISRVFDSERPEVVFHAAAHKHVPILETYPSEAVRTNVHGTDVLLRTAVRFGTERFVAISTDKAVAPTSVMGASKRLAEQLLVHRRTGNMRYCAVRFGNVLGSRGSVVPTFIRQVTEGGPVTVTHPDMTRFFMTTREAVHLVMQAATRCEGGEVFMLDMGKPVRIVDLAERIISLSGPVAGEPVAIEFTGLRPGEKLSEQLYSSQETVDATSHPKIMLVRGPRISAQQLLEGVGLLVDLAERQDEPRVRELLFELARMPHELDLEGQFLAAARSYAPHAEPAQSRPTA